MITAAASERSSILSIPRLHPKGYWSWGSENEDALTMLASPLNSPALINPLLELYSRSHQDAAEPTLWYFSLLSAVQALTKSPAFAALRSTALTDVKGRVFGLFAWSIFYIDIPSCPTLALFPGCVGGEKVLSLLCSLGARLAPYIHWKHVLEKAKG